MILIFLGLAVILGFIFSLGPTLLVSKLKTRLRVSVESRTTIKKKKDELEKLEHEDVDTFMEMIKSLRGTLKKQEQKEETEQFSQTSDGKGKQAGTEGFRYQRGKLLKLKYPNAPEYSIAPLILMFCLEVAHMKARQT
ncbi:MAG TPA: hypothetical protein VJ695_10040 [Nitrososphaera sp.]|nr:hypothetical protein [Nitrososphaera sp.]